MGHNESVSKGSFIVLSTIRNQESQTNGLITHLGALEKQEQAKP